MQIGAEESGAASGGRAKRWLAVGFSGVLGLLLAGCSSSYNPVNWFGDGTPKPQQIAMPDEDAADQGELPQGLSGDSSGRSYADGGRSDVTVVRPLRKDAPPKVSVGSVPPAPAAAPAAPVERVAPPPAPVAGDRSAAVAQAGDLPAPPPGAPLDMGDPRSASVPRGGSRLSSEAQAEGLQSLEAFAPENYGLSYLAATVPFGHGSAHLSAADTAALRQVAQDYKRQGGVVTVVGHASSRTGEMPAVSHKIANFDISVRRAEVVAQALLRQGVPAKALYVGAVSDAEPVYQEVMPSGEANNRRTEVFLNH
jgi:outer membrane protein OmpA-like peptidoglycan-associated protein